jgi:hypothetical protein
MAFDEIPEDRERGYPCGQYDETAPAKICEGSIIKFDGRWQCDTCQYDYGGDKLTEPDCTEL